MKVLGLCASQRKLGNSEILLKEMMLHFPENSQKKLIRLTDLEIKPCTACYACLPEDKPCVLKDDLQFLLREIQEADVILIASPVYFLGIHNSLKMIQDRFISVLNKGRLFSGKKCLLAIPYGVKDWEGSAFSQLNAFAHFLHLDVSGSLLIQAPNPGEVINSENLTKIKNLVLDLLSGSHEKHLPLETNNCPQCGSDILQFHKTGKIRCVYCNLEGKLITESGRIYPEFDLSDSNRFSLKGMKHHAEHLEEIKQNYLSKRQELNEIRKPYRKFDSLWILPDREISQ